LRYAFTDEEYEDLSPDIDEPETRPYGSAGRSLAMNCCYPAKIDSRGTQTLEGIVAAYLRDNAEAEARYLRFSDFHPGG